MTFPAAVRGAVAGTLHGVAEWLPVSSSGHVALLIEAARWPEAEPARRQERRALEVALHTGSLVPIGRRVLADVHEAERPVVLVLSGLAATAITSVIGGTAGPAIEARFAGPKAVAAGLVAGSVALVAAEGLAGRGDDDQRSMVGLDIVGVRRVGRPLRTLMPADVIAVGVAQGMAIWPGVSRRAATLAAARARGLDPAAADTLSWATGLPTLAAATVWQFWRSRRTMVASPAAPLAGAAASALAGHATRRLPARTAPWPASRWALWRVALAAATLLHRSFGQAAPRIVDDPPLRSPSPGP
jgi:undecaprenyl-diphosphatase